MLSYCSEYYLLGNVFTDQLSLNPGKQTESLLHSQRLIRMLSGNQPKVCMRMFDIQKLKPKYITDENGNKIEVILSMETFRALLEDIQDLAVRAERLDEETLSHSELLKELKADSIL